MFCQFSDRPNKAKSGSQIPESTEASMCDVWESGCSARDFTLELTMETDRLYLNGELSEIDKIVS